MSGIAVCFDRTGRQVDQPEIARLTDGVSHRGPDGTAIWRHGNVALGVALSATTPNAANAQPARDRDASLALVLDGFLADRHGLGRALGFDALAADRMADAALCLAAYKRWGEDAFARLVGDFAVIVWDGIAERIVCARDVFGARPLFYRVTADGIWGASAIAALSATPGGLAPNEGMIGEWLCGHPVHISDTVYADVHRLAPGHLLVADRRHHRVTRYWGPDGLRELRYRTDADYEEHLRTLFDEVVADCTRVPDGQRVGLMLSGGLDSGSILASAARQGVAVSALTIGYEDPALDESPLAGAVVRHAGVTDWETVAPSITDLDPAAETRATLDIPTCPSGAASLALRRRAAARGIRVMLTGVGGDEWFFGSEWRGADLLATGRLAAFCRHWRASLDRPDSIGSLGVWRNALWPLVPPVLQGAVRAVAKRRRLPPWIDQTWARQAGLTDRLRLGRPAVPARSYAVRDLMLGAWSGAALNASQEQDRFSAQCGLEDRQPFFDRRLVELALALPETQRWRDGWPKSIVRRAFADRLPRATLDRRDQPDYGMLTSQVLRHVGGAALLANSRLAALGWLRRDALARLAAELEESWQTGRHGPAVDKAWGIVAVELWYRASLGRDG